MVWAVDLDDPTYTSTKDLAAALGIEPADTYPYDNFNETGPDMGTTAARPQ